MRNVLVTGGCGYIGSVLIPMLLEHGYRVRVLDKLYFGSASLAPVLSSVELVAGDVRTVDFSVLDNIEAVVHLGSLSNDPTADFHPEAAEAINCAGTLRLATECKRRGIGRFTFASSCAVYGFHVEDVVDESYPTSPQSSYAASKLAAEVGLLALAGPDFQPAILRQATVYGLSPRMRWDLVLNAFVMHAFRCGRLDVWFGGDAWRPLVHVRDVALAHLLCLEAAEDLVAGEVFNVVYENYRILDLAEGAARTLSESGTPVKLEVNRDRVDPRSYRCSAARMEKRLGFRPSVSPEDAVCEIAAGLRAGLNRNFDHPIYYNMPWLQLLLDVEERIRATGPIL